RSAGALVSFEGGVAAGVAAATRALSAGMRASLRELDPRRHVGIGLVNGLGPGSEATNEALGHAAPFLSFVGGSAGDDFGFKVTHMHHNGVEVTEGAALLVLELEAPHAIVKASSFEVLPTHFSVTRAEPRVICELDGEPAA